MNIYSVQFQNFIDNLSCYLEEKKPFVVYERNEEFELCRAISSSWELDKGNAEFLIDKSIQLLRERNLRVIPSNEGDRLQDLTNVACQAIRNLENIYPDHTGDLDLLKRKALAAKMGGVVSPEIFAQSPFMDLRKILEKNTLQHQFQSLHLQMKERMGAPCIEILNERDDPITVYWNFVTKQSVYNDEGVHTGYRFYYFGREILNTELDYSFNENYVMTYKGLKKHNPSSSSEIITYDKLPPDGKFTFEIITVLRDRSGRHPGSFFGNHSYALLKDVEGNLKSDGKFGPNKYSCEVSPLGKKVGQFLSPDIYVYYARDTRSFEKFTFEINQQQYQRILARWQNDKMHPTSFSPLKENCSTYLKEILKEELGIQVETEMTITRFVFSQVFPKSIVRTFVKGWESLMDPMPKWLQNIFHFTPIIYIPQFIIHFGAKCLSLFNDENHFGSDLSFIDIVFRPWNCYIDHPLVMRKGLKRLAPRGCLNVSNNR